MSDRRQDDDWAEFHCEICIKYYWGGNININLEVQFETIFDRFLKYIKKIIDD